MEQNLSVKGSQGETFGCTLDEVSMFQGWDELAVLERIAGTDKMICGTHVVFS